MRNSWPLLADKRRTEREREIYSAAYRHTRMIIRDSSLRTITVYSLARLVCSISLHVVPRYVNAHTHFAHFVEPRERRDLAIAHTPSLAKTTFIVRNDIVPGRVSRLPSTTLSVKNDPRDFTIAITRRIACEHVSRSVASKLRAITARDLIERQSSAISQCRC